MDSLEEWRRLKELYERMNEGELEVVASEAYDLTDIAKPLLRDEIARRGLKIELRTERARRGEGAPSSKLDLAVVGTLWSLEDALKAKEFLDEKDVPGYWGADNTMSLEGLRASFADGIDLKVREDQVRVIVGLARLFPTAAEEDCNFVCPKCHSPEIVFHDLDEAAKFNWSCDACGHEWARRRRRAAWLTPGHKESGCEHHERAGFRDGGGVLKLESIDREHVIAARPREHHRSDFLAGVEDP